MKFETSGTYNTVGIRVVGAEFERWMEEMRYEEGIGGSGDAQD